MDFVLSKELRTLGVVEFVLFFFGPVELQCPCIDLSYFVKASELIFTALELGVYIALLVLFRRDVRVCDDSLITTVLILVVVCLGLKLLNKILNRLFSKLLEKKAKELDQGKLLGDLVDSMNKPLETMEKNMSKLKKFVTIFQKGRLLFIPLVVICVLLLLAWAIFFFATSIKLAIPEEFEASCIDNSNISKVIMLVLPSLAIAFYLIGIAFNVGSFFYARKLDLSEVNLVKLGIKYSLIEYAALIIPALAMSVFSFILFIRLLKVWRGEELELYEFVALSICTPLLPLPRSGPTATGEVSNSPPPPQSSPF